MPVRSPESSAPRPQPAPPPGPEALALPAPYPFADRRVRFVGLHFHHPRTGRCAATVTLEWGGEQYEATQSGEAGWPGELRVGAQAAADALERVLQGRLTLEVLGVKATRIFDQDMVAVLLRCPQAPERRLVGVSLALQDVHRSTALAVLNATNRLLGNFLVVGD